MDNNLLPIDNTIEGLREALFDEINAFREGKGNPARARAICTAAKNIVDSIRVQIQYQRISLKGGIALGSKRFLPK